MARDFKSEYKNYQGKPDQIKKRAERNAAHRAMTKAGRVKPGQDVDHVRPISKGGTNAKGNLRAISEHSNRSFARTSTGAMKGK